MNEEQKETLGGIADKVNNLTGALEIPMPADFHVTQLKSILPEVVQELRDLYKDVTGENPWETLESIEEKK
ncbi:hypothetical protein CMT42_14785 [Elizabethkingia anophelis]|uniref:hypothetical protein n=1 Tax=Elizabethkingia anophelis TaxID=1117645 RepID=UPI00099A860B|nr:hypothetical protein [Elizabethkingia anophelis]MDV3894518.1 hypothetical protein [Elizabethkingia anophelis]MDV3914527.1 hypothetical protein [Elizabethkingia anophelis]MDV3920725.1 hypothetical protein [Elizabethkingia anophelis]MDV3959188.1 hypothetical protein [Elizabethkingia anophelis]MDV3965545.1 hypothetical protein [Elizabethkingia anophelis]